MKRGLVGMIILIVLGSLIVLGVGAGVYFYNFFVFKEFRACVGNWQDTTFLCESRDDCLAGMNFSIDEIEEMPDFIEEKFNAILDSVVYCDGTCYVGAVRGVDYGSGELEELESCEAEEEEFVVEIRGKEGIEILKWLRDTGKI